MAENSSGPYKVKRGDTATPIEGTLFDANGQPAPLPPGTAIFFAMRAAVAGMGYTPIKKPAEIADENGRFRYWWDPEDIAMAGPFKAEVEVEYPGGPQTFPSDGYMDILVLADIG